MAAVAHIMPVPTDARRGRFGVFAVAVGVLMIDAEHALDATDNAANCGTDNGADRTGNAIALIETMRGTTRNALRLRGDRRGKKRQNGTHDCNSNFHEPPMC